MNNSTEARGFTDTLLSAVRLQRHLGARMIISTQEPTISTALLNLCSITIVHRFTSPEWLRVLYKHLAGAAENPFGAQTGPVPTCQPRSLFHQIVELRVGQALLFAPSALIGVKPNSHGDIELERLGSGKLCVQIRHRLTSDGGKSVLAL